MKWLGVVLVLLFCGPAWAQSEDDIFNDNDDTPVIDESKLDKDDDKLQLGGLMYMRLSSTITDGDSASDHSVSMPNLVDLYLDGRPNDRIRGFVRARLLWDPTTDDDGMMAAYGAEPVETRVQLDQLWLKFDIARTVWVTLGQQHVRWGASRLWNPVEMVNSNRRAPLTLFDERRGITALKLHVPVESLGWNFYLLSILDNANDVSDLHKVAARGEFVFSTVELGVSASTVDDLVPKVGLDVSMGVWDLDITGEFSWRRGAYNTAEEDNVFQASGGVDYGIRYSDDDSLYLGVEYFYNSNGGELDVVGIFVDGDPFQFFYTGKHYVAGFLSVPAPGSWNDSTFLTSTVVNLTDKSAVARFDYSQRVLTYLTVQAFVSAHLGEPGELNFGGDVLPSELKDAAVDGAAFNGVEIDRDKLDLNPIVSLGLWLRIDI